MTTAIVATAFGGPEVLSVVDVPLPEPAAGEVSISIRAAGVNPVDYKMYSGNMGSDESSLPMRLGYEAAGVVSAVGADAEEPAGSVNVGDEVIAFRVSAAYAADLTVPASAVVPKPSGMSWEQAAGLMLTGVTAYHALEATGVGQGDTVLIHGASGGVGLSAVQIAVDRGAHVVGTAGEARQDLLHRYGVQPVAYGDGLADRVREVAPDGVDAAIDTVGTDEAVDVSLELVDDRDRIASIAAFQRGRGAGIKLLGDGPGADPGTELRDAARLVLSHLVEDGKLEVVVVKTFPLDEAAEAHRFLAGGHPGGKVVLVP